MKIFHFFSCHDIKMRLCRHIFELEMTPSFFMSQHFYPWHIPTKFQHHLESERKLRQFASLIMFLAKCSPINWLPWQQEMTYPQVFNF